jgi:hypothetical protein
MQQLQGSQETSQEDLESVDNLGHFSMCGRNMVSVRTSILRQLGLSPATLQEG